MAKKAFDYQAQSTELNEIVSKLQSSDLDVDEAVKAYERGIAIVKELEAYLKKAEIKVKKIANLE